MIYKLTTHVCNKLFRALKDDARRLVNDAPTVLLFVLRLITILVAPIVLLLVLVIYPLLLCSERYRKFSEDEMKRELEEAKAEYIHPDDEA